MTLTEIQRIAPPPGARLLDAAEGVDEPGGGPAASPVSWNTDPVLYAIRVPLSPYGGSSGGDDHDRQKTS
jgi:hypothetical protein